VPRGTSGDIELLTLRVLESFYTKQVQLVKCLYCVILSIILVPISGANNAVPYSKTLIIWQSSNFKQISDSSALMDQAFWPVPILKFVLKQ
jgi:hypothetical protein